MPVFDFTHTPDEKKPAECTYTVFYSNEQHPTEDNPLMVLERLEEGSCHHPVGLITNPIKKTAFEYTGQNGTVSANILKMDARFVGFFSSGVCVKSNTGILVLLILHLFSFIIA